MISEQDSLKSAETKETPSEEYMQGIKGLGGAALNLETPHPAGAQEHGEADFDAEQRLELAEKWFAAQNIEYEEIEPVPVAIASEISILAQKRYNQLDDGIIDEEMVVMERIRNEAIGVADKLDFELVRISGGDWPLHARLNIMHEKFDSVSPGELSSVLNVDDSQYEYTAFRLCNIIADHAPALLTENLRALVDPATPLWRACSTHASILLRNRTRTNIEPMRVEQVPTSLPASGRAEYRPEDDMSMTAISSMGDDELALYCRPEFVDSVKERGYASFSELNLPAREAQLTRRLFEVVGKSNNQDLKREAGERNRALEREPVLEEGDFVHATGSSEVFEKILSNGLRCGEAIMGNDRSTIKYPFTVSFLEVNEKIAEPNSLSERLNLLKNDAYGAINMVLHRDAASTDHVKGQRPGVVNQRQIFGGAPSTEIKSIVIRENEASEQVVEDVIKAIVENGMFIPVYSSVTGESLLTSDQFDQLSKMPSR